MPKRNTTKKITEDNQIPLLVRSGQWQVVERIEEYIFAVCPKNRQDDRIDEQKKLIDQLTKKLRSQDKQMNEQKECIRSQDERIKSQDARINLQNGQIKKMNECICSQDEQIQAQNKLITELQAKWKSHEESVALINQSKETGQASNGKPAVLMMDTCDVSKESFVFGSRIKRKEISAIYTQNTLKNVSSDAWDVSAEKDGSVMAWTCKGADSDTYILYLAGDGEIYANPDSSYLFTNYENLTKADFTHLKTDLVTNMKNMFWYCSQLQTLDVSRWDVCNVTDMSNMFSSCNAVDHMKDGELSSWKLHPSVILENFCKGTKFEETPTALFQIPKVISLEEPSSQIDQSKETGQFSSGKPAVLMTDICNMDIRIHEEDFVFGSKIKREEISAIYTQNTLKNVSSDAWDVSAEKDGSVKAWTCKAADRDTYILYLAGDGDIYANPDSSCLFANYGNLIKADFTHLKTDLVTNMNRMFSHCRQLQTLDVTKWDVSNVADMNSMFCGCRQLQTLDVTKWDVSNVANMGWMFYDCSQLQTLDVTKWNVCNVKYMSWMFDDCSQLQTLDVSKWNVSNVTDMERMFGNCSQLQVLDVSKWDVCNVKDMSCMFWYCSQLQTLDVSRWDVCNVKDMSWMFSSCSAVDHMKEGELSSWKLHTSVNLEDFCKGTKFEGTPTALFQSP